jgi:hypothetical protein
VPPEKRKEKEKKKKEEGGEWVGCRGDGNLNKELKRTDETLKKSTLINIKFANPWRSQIHITIHSLCAHC